MCPCLSLLLLLCQAGRRSGGGQPTTTFHHAPASTLAATSSPTRNPCPRLFRSLQLAALKGLIGEVRLGLRQVNQEVVQVGGELPGGGGLKGDTQEARWPAGWGAPSVEHLVAQTA